MKARLANPVAGFGASPSPHAVQTHLGFALKCRVAVAEELLDRR